MKRQEFFEKWIEALPKFKQAVGMLRTGVRKFRYCCLGAACVVANETGFMKIDLEAEQGNSESLPIKLAKRLNITVSGSFKNYVEYKGKPYISLVDLNDDAKANFKDIARIIREQLAAKNFEPYEW